MSSLVSSPLTISCKPTKALRTLSPGSISSSWAASANQASASKPAPAQLRPISRPCSSAGVTGWPLLESSMAKAL
ncbi:hypothetical protein D9M73_225720 [compost metagenome]